MSPAPQAGAGGAQKGYGFLNASATSDTAAQYTGENLTSMFKMTSPVATGAAPRAKRCRAYARAADRRRGTPRLPPLPLILPRSRLRLPVVRYRFPIRSRRPRRMYLPSSRRLRLLPERWPASRARQCPRTAQWRKPTSIRNRQRSIPQCAEPLTRRQRRLLRKQQEQQAPFLPWLR